MAGEGRVGMAAVPAAGGCPQPGSAQCSLQHSQGSPVPGSALALRAMVGHRASAQHCPSSHVHSHRGSQTPQRSQLSVSTVCQHSLPSPWVCPAKQELLCAHSHVSTHTPTQGALQPRGCWLRLPGCQSQGRLCSACCPERSCPLGEPQGVPQENLTVRYLQPDPTLGLWFPPCFLLPQHPQHLGQK